MQANIFDLTPRNTAGKYTAKKGVDAIDGLLHKVMSHYSFWDVSYAQIRIFFFFLVVS